jgi:hypothetical protein
LRVLSFTDVVRSLNVNVDNPPDPLPCPIHVCGKVDSIYTDLPEYGRYRGYNVKTACWVKEHNRLVDFVVRVIVAPNPRFDKTPLPQLNSFINVHGYLFGRDKALDMLIIMLKEFSFLPKSSSTSDGSSAEEAVQPETPRKKGWRRAPPATPSSNPAASPSASTSSTPHAVAEHKTPQASLTPVPSTAISSTLRAVAERESTNPSPTPVPSTATPSAPRAVAKRKHMPPSRASGPSTATAGSASASILDLDDGASSSELTFYYISFVLLFACSFIVN